jgi:hypothetical protein
MAAAAIQYGSRSPYRGLIPQPIAAPVHEPRTGMMTAASEGPSFATPTSGFTTLQLCTSWSYCRITHSLEQTE